MHSIRLIAMDMDGTLLDQRQAIPEENLTVLREAAQKGIHLAICSGRSAADISYFASDAGLDSCHVLALNGACCLDTPHGKPYAVHTVPDAVARQVLTVLLRNQVTFACFQAERVIVLENSPSTHRLNWGTYVARGNADAYAYGEEALRRYLPEGICKFVYIDEDRSPRLERVRQELLPIAGITVTSSWSDNLELMPEGVGKGTALKELATRLQVPAAQVMALGDYDNDLEMIAFAGCGVAMGNASERIKQTARHTTLTNEQNGVAAAIRRYALPLEPQC